MANYTIVDFKTSTSKMSTVLAELETKLETLDSTTNVIRLLEVKNCGNAYIGILIYDG